MSLRAIKIIVALAWCGLITFVVITLHGCASAYLRPPITIEETCPDDETCVAATPEEIREFFRRYDE